MSPLTPSTSGANAVARRNFFDCVSASEGAPDRAYSFPVDVGLTPTIKIEGRLKPQPGV